jgi:hypothetical protein
MFRMQSIGAPMFRKSETERTAVRESVTSGSALTGSYLAMNTAAALIAAFGLLQNSPAVIIGAMLIAMLFGPIVGIALGLAEANLFLAPAISILGNRGCGIGTGDRLYDRIDHSEYLDWQRDPLAHLT